MNLSNTRMDNSSKWVGTQHISVSPREIERNLNVKSNANDLIENIACESYYASEQVTEENMKKKLGPAGFIEKNYNSIRMAFRSM